MSTTTAERNRELVLGALGAARSGDMASFFKAVHPRVKVYEPSHLPYGGLHEGPDAFVRMLAQAVNVIDLETLELVSATSDEERTVLLMTLRLRGSGEVMHVTEHWRVEGGVITEVRVFWFDCPDLT